MIKLIIRMIIVPAVRRNMMLSYLDAHKSHSQNSSVITKGYPLNVEKNIDNIYYKLNRSQKGYERRDRMKIKYGSIEIQSNVKEGKDAGAAVNPVIINSDYESLEELMTVYIKNGEKVTKNITGHADTDSALKYSMDGIRNVYTGEIETAKRASIDLFCMELLKIFNVKIYSRAVRTGNIEGKSTIDFNCCNVCGILKNSPAGFNSYHFFMSRVKRG
jgi:chorismate synthase